MFEGVDPVAALPLLDAIPIPSAAPPPDEGIAFLQPAEMDALTDTVASSQYDYDTIYVWGRRYYDGGWGWSGGGGGGGGGDNSNVNDQEGAPTYNPMDADHQLTEDADDTPCVNQIPAGVDLDHLNDLAKFMGTKLAGLQDSTGWEWGAIIYRGSDGALYQSDPFTAYLHDSITGARITLPAGAHIVGYLHTHPEDPLMDQRTLSPADRGFLNDLTSSAGGSVTADPYIISYVVTADNAVGYHTYVYDKSDRDADHPGCDL